MACIQVSPMDQNKSTHLCYCNCFVAIPSHVLLFLLLCSEVYKTVRQVALKALRGRFNQQRFREFKHEAEMLQLLQGSSVRAILFPALLRCDRYVK